MMKTCSKCKIEKDIDDFHRNKSSKDGHVSICKSCACAKTSAWVKDNPERHAASGAAYRESHPATKRKENKAALLALTERCCTNCGETKPIDAFGRTSKKKGNMPLAVCKECAAMQTGEWQKKNPAKRAVISARYYKNNPEKFIAYRPRQEELRLVREEKNPGKSAVVSAAWRTAHKDEISVNYAIWKRNNRARCTALQVAREAQKIKATPAWADERLIQFKYDLAARMTKATGYQWDVDHVVPLKHKLVCGLHVENNLQVITHTKNLRKSNKWQSDVVPNNEPNREY